MLLWFSPGAKAGPPASFDQIGVTVLRERDSSLVGSGVTVAQVEALQTVNNAYQPSPASAGLDASRFLFYDVNNPFPGVGGFQIAADHANNVAGNFYGVTTGVASGVAAIRVSEANYFFTNFIDRVAPLNIGAQVINQSFVIGTSDTNAIFAINLLYDNYVAQFGTVIVSGAGNGGQVSPPSTMYNGLSVGVVGMVTTPPSDGRCKPDLIAPGGPPGNLTSYSTPYVSGAAAVLIQSALRQDGGAGTASLASDRRVVKALLLNGAVKPAGWTTAPAQPLDRASGAGVLDVNRSQLQLAAGNYAPTITTTVAANASHPPPAGISNYVASYHGWQFASISTSGTSDAVDHYFFQLSRAVSSNFALTGTLVWERQFNQTAINNLDLYLYEADSGVLVTNSVSTIDNVQQLYLPNLAPGNYVLQVVKRAAGQVSYGETYALAFAFDPLPPPAPTTFSAVTVSAAITGLSWDSEAAALGGFRLERSTNALTGFQTVVTLAPGTTAFQDAGLAAGTTYYYQLIAVNSGVDSAAATLQTTTYTAREYWRLLNFGTTNNTGAAADGADPDQDGLPNLVEYALGANPNVAAPHSAWPAVGIYQDGVNQYLMMSVARNGIQPEVLYTVESAADLSGNWSTNVTVLTNAAKLLEVRDNVPLTQSGARFLRFSVTGQ